MHSKPGASQFRSILALKPQPNIMKILAGLQPRP
jgi:hypothetical protein